MEWNGIECMMADEWANPNRTGLDWSGLNMTGRYGLGGGAGLDSTAQDWSGLGWAGLDRTGQIRYSYVTCNTSYYEYEQPELMLAVASA
eukprot:scaffold504512_cov19-Prasinocladus_malaysianus.AAC.1